MACDKAVRLSRRRVLQGSLALAGLSLASGCGTLPSVEHVATKIPRLGYLTLSYFPEPLHAAFRLGLSELGYVDGRTVTIDFRAADDNEGLPKLAAELVGLKVDVLVAAGAAGVRPLQEATTSIPIVCPTFGDPVASGSAASLARPGGNVTGLSLLTPQLGMKRLELLKETVPGFARLGAVLNPNNPAGAAELQQTQIAAQALAVHVVPLEVRRSEDIDRAFEAALNERVDALIMLVDALISDQQTRILDFAATLRLPTMYYTKAQVDGGALMAYGVRHADNFRRAATYVDKILKGAKPGDLPIEQPTTFELVVNLKTAQSLGLTIPQSILQQATEIIQ